MVPHVVVPAAGLAGRLPAGVGLALNPDSLPGLPVYPECVPYLAWLAAGTDAHDGLAMERLLPGTGTRFLIGHPPAEPRALLAEARTALRALPHVFEASRAWLSVPGHGAGLVIAVGLDDPASDQDRTAALDAIERAVAKVPLRVPFALDVTFPGEPGPGTRDPGALVPEARLPEGLAPEASASGTRAADAIDAWIAVNTRPFHVRG